MDIMMQNPAFARINQDGAGSVSAFAAVGSSRWVLTGMALGWSTAASCTISLYEIDSTNSAAFFVMMTSATSGFRAFNFAPLGIPASSSYTSKMVFNVGAAGTFSAMFTGYYIGA